VVVINLKGEGSSTVHLSTSPDCWVGTGALKSLQWWCVKDGKIWLASNQGTNALQFQCIQIHQGRRRRRHVCSTFKRTLVFSCYNSCGQQYRTWIQCC
jgi:hypothetical protein